MWYAARKIARLYASFRLYNHLSKYSFLVISSVVSTTMVSIEKAITKGPSI